MTEPTVWKGLADVRPRPDADFEGAGAYMNVMVFARDHDEAAQVVAAAMDDHGCDLVGVELDPVDVALEESEHAADWRRIAGGLGPDRPVWCQGTFHIYEHDDDA